MRYVCMCVLFSSSVLWALLIESATWIRFVTEREFRWKCEPKIGNQWMRNKSELGNEWRIYMYLWDIVRIWEREKKVCTGEFMSDLKDKFSLRKKSKEKKTRHAKWNENVSPVSWIPLKISKLCMAFEIDRISGFNGSSSQFEWVFESTSFCIQSALCVAYS